MIAPVLLGTALLLVAGSPLRAQSEVTSDPDSAAMSELEALEYHLIDLLEQRDLDAYASHLAGDYTRVNAAGRVDSKESVLAQFRSDSGSVTSTPSDMEIRIYGNTAILSFILTLQREDEIVRRSRLVKVFVRRDGRWIMVHNQGTPID